MPRDKRPDKDTELYPLSGYTQQEKEQGADTQQPRSILKHVECAELGRDKNEMLHDSIYMKLQKRQI